MHTPSNNTGLCEREDLRGVKIDDCALDVLCRDFVSKGPLMKYIKSLKRHQIS
jgi:hypothetical protein